jgi:hypothetical protein
VADSRDCLIRHSPEIKRYYECCHIVDCTN